MIFDHVNDVSPKLFFKIFLNRMIQLELCFMKKDLTKIEPKNFSHFNILILLNFNSPSYIINESILLQQIIKNILQNKIKNQKRNSTRLAIGLDAN